jgi:cell division protein FtsB
MMKEKINEFQTNAKQEIKRLCGRPSPMKRLALVIVVCLVLAVANIWFLVSSIYNIGKNDAEKELMKLQHIEKLELPKRKEVKEIKEFEELKENNEYDE